MKKSMQRCVKLSNKDAFFNLFKAYKWGLEQYAALLASKLPKATATSGPLSATALSEREVSPLTPRQLNALCLIVNTAEYCMETLPQLAGSIERLIDPLYKEHIEMEVLPRCLLPIHLLSTSPLLCDDVALFCLLGVRLLLKHAPRTHTQQPLLPASALPPFLRLPSYFTLYSLPCALFRMPSSRSPSSSTRLSAAWSEAHWLPALKCWRRCPRCHGARGRQWGIRACTSTTFTPASKNSSPSPPSPCPQPTAASTARRWYENTNQK